MGLRGKEMATLGYVQSQIMVGYNNMIARQKKMYLDKNVLSWKYFVGHKIYNVAENHMQQLMWAQKGDGSV